MIILSQMSNYGILNTLVMCLGQLLALIFHDNLDFKNEGYAHSSNKNIKVLERKIKIYEENL